MPGRMELMLRLILALVLGGLIGIERETHRRPAGLRTHILVCMGSTLVMLISAYAFNDATWPGRDPARIAAQVVSGIGFLGAGTILREGATVIGLTTAASLWVVAGIGLALGIGFYLEAAFVAGLTFVVLFFLDRFERRIIYSKREAIYLKVADKPGALGKVATALGKYGVSIKGIDLEVDEEEDVASIELSVHMPLGISREKLFEEVSKLEEVRSVRSESPR